MGDREKRMNLGNVPFVEGVNVPDSAEERAVTDYVETADDKIIEVPHIQYVERFQEVPVNIPTKRYTRAPKMEVMERTIEIPREGVSKVVEVPQVHIVDKIVEIPDYIIKEKTVERPKVIIQERIVPVAKRTIEEKIIEVPEDKFNEVVQRHMETMEARYEAVEETGYQEAVGKADMQAKVKHRHNPQPVTIPMMHYKPAAIERTIDRAVPIPVEIDMTQVFHCPKLLADYKEVATPIHVVRTIERPVPADALGNKGLLNLYMFHGQDLDRFHAEAKRANACGRGPTLGRKAKMTDAEIRAAGLTTNLATLKTMNSRAFDMASRGGVNMSFAEGLFQARELQRDEAPTEIIDPALEKGLVPEGQQRR